MNMDFIRQEFDALVEELGSAATATEYLCYEVEEKYFSTDISSFFILVIDITRSMIGAEKHIAAVRNARTFGMTTYEVATLVPLEHEQHRSLGLALMLIKYMHQERGVS